MSFEPPPDPKTLKKELNSESIFVFVDSLQVFGHQILTLLMVKPALIVKLGCG